jgi:hypothetical protein
MTRRQLLGRCVLGTIGTLIAVVVALIVPSVGWPLLAVCLIGDALWLLFRVVRVGSRQPRRPGMGAETAGRWFRRQWERSRDLFGHLVHGFKEEKKQAPAAAKPKRGAPQTVAVPYGRPGGGGGRGGAVTVAATMEAVSPADMSPELAAAHAWLANYEFEDESDIAKLARAFAAFKLACAMTFDDHAKTLIDGEEIGPLALSAMAEFGESEGISAQGALAIYLFFAEHFAEVKAWLDDPDHQLPKHGGRRGFLRPDGEAA